MWKKVAKSSGILTVGNISSRLFISGFRYLAALSLSMSDYGIFAFFVSVLNYGANLSTLQLNVGMIKYMSEVKSLKYRKNIYFTIRNIGLFTSGIVSLIVIVLFLMMGYGEFFIFIPLYIIFYTILNINNGLFISEFKFMTSSIINSLKGIFIIVLGLILYLYNILSLYWAIVIMIISIIITCLISDIIILKMYKPDRLSLFHIDKILSKRILRYSVFLSITSFALGIFPVLGRTILILGSSEDVALYDIAYLLYSFIILIFTPIVNTTTVYLSNSIKNGLYKMILPRWEDYLFILLICSVLQILLNTHLIKSIFIIIGLKNYIPALQILSVFILEIPIHIIYFIDRGILQAIGNTQTLAKISLIALGFYILILYFLVLILSITGSAIAYLLAFSLVALLLEIEIMKIKNSDMFSVERVSFTKKFIYWLVNKLEVMR